jgi:hypothetical protein
MAVMPGRPKGKRPSAKPPTSTVPVSATGTKPTGTKSTGTKTLGKKSTGTSSKNKGGSPADKSLRMQEERDERAGKSELQKARDLEAQLEAFKLALSKKGLSKARRQNIQDVERALRSQLREAKTAATQRYDAFLTAGRNAEMDTGRVAETGITNMMRERQEAMTQLLSQGAGETDAMRAMLMAARNWQSNAGESNRAYFDSMASTNAGITDLSLDTETSMANAWRGAESEKDRLWQEYWKSRADTFTSRSNVYNQMMAHYRVAEAYDVEPKKGKKKEAKAGIEEDSVASAKAMSKSYRQKRLPGWIAKYSAGPQLEAKQNNTNLAAAMTIEPTVKAEGASLRRWEEGEAV